MPTSLGPCPRLRIIGSGRAGRSFGCALSQAGWVVDGLLDRHHCHGEALTGAARGVDLLLIATPDDAIAGVAGAVAPVPTTVVAHVAGSLGCDILGRHLRRAAIHPLASLPDEKIGAARLLSGIWYAVSGDPVAWQVVESLGGRPLPLADGGRGAYHAAAVIASNHLVALLGQVERVAALAGLPLAPYLDLARATVDNVAALGPAGALTGPAARGDRQTVARHLTALPADERLPYQVMADQAVRLVAPGRAPIPASNGSAKWGGKANRGGKANKGGIGGAERGPAGPLIVLDRRDAFATALETERAAGRTIGLVPTMGYLHTGHTSLMRLAAAKCDVVAATSFVNPLQFGPSEDLASYPRDPEGDRCKAEDCGVRYLFAPPPEEMFPEPPLTTVSVGRISEVLEGAARPRHFAGVATIVTKLLALAGPCRAYFGEKDYQQLVVIRRLVTELSLPVEVIGCPTVRDPDGLALSSRNVYLTLEERAIAPTLHRALQAGRAAIEEAGTTDADAVRQIMRVTVEAEPRFILDYAEVADPEDLSPLTSVTSEARLLIAAHLGQARLIDNLGAHG